MSKSKTKEPTLVDQLREAIKASDKSLNELSRVTGVHVSRISRFVRGERSIDVAAASAICQALGYQLTKATPDQGGLTEAPPAPPKPRKRGGK